MPIQLRHRGRITSGSMAALVLLIGAVPQAASANVKPSAVSWGLTSQSVAIRGIGAPVRLELWSTQLQGGGAFVTVSLRRTFSGKSGDSSGTVAWTTTAKMACNVPFDDCSLTDAGALGTYGHLALIFKPTAAVTTATEMCPNGTTVRRVTKERRGVLTGDLTLDTKTAYYGVIRNAPSGDSRVALRIPTVASRSATYQCPASAAMVIASACDSAANLRSADGWWIQLSRGNGYNVATVFARLDAPSLQPGVEISVTGSYHGRGARSALALTNTPAALWAADSVLPSNPFIKGEARFDEHAPLVVKQVGGCTVKSRLGTIDTGIKVTMTGYPAVAIGNSGGKLTAWLG